MALLATAAIAGAAFGCTRSADVLPGAEDQAARAPAGQEPAAAADEEGDAHIAAVKAAGGVGVTPESTSGSEEVLPVESDFPCAEHSDCTSTKYANVPKDEDDCECAAACTPYVVNKSVAARRKEANLRLCQVSDWYGDQCPAPECGFQEFESFKCVAGKCVGMALGK